MNSFFPQAELSSGLVHYFWPVSLFGCSLLGLFIVGYCYFFVFLARFTDLREAREAERVYCELRAQLQRQRFSNRRANRGARRNYPVKLNRRYP